MKEVEGMPVEYHVYAWIIAYILFAVLVFTPIKHVAVHMILRLAMVVIIITGLILTWRVFEIEPFWVTVKLVLGIGIVGMFEVIIGKQKRKESTKMSWILMAVLTAGVFFLGYVTLPL